MVIPKKVLAISTVVIVVAALVLVFVLKKTPAKGTEASAASTASESGSNPDSLSPQEKAETAPLPVKVAPVKRGDLVIKLKSPGEAYTDRMIAVKAEVGGVVKTLAAYEGRHVKQDEVLVELDDREYRLTLEKADALRLKYLSDLYLEQTFRPAPSEIDPAKLAHLKETETAFRKAAAALDRGQISRDDYEKVQKDYELALIETGQKKEEIMAASKGLTQAEIDVKMARLELEKTVVRAPFAGVVTDVKISQREHVEAGRELFSLVDIGRIRVKARVLESEVGRIKPGRSVDLRFSAYPDKVFSGTVEAVAPIVNAEDKTCPVYIALRNPNEEIKPGMHAEVEIAAQIYPDRLLVPQAAILVRGGRKLVFTVENGLAKWRYVTVGVENEDFAEILPSDRPEEGVKEGDLVITEGHFTLAHDTRVAVKD
jgi:RND family efflux transporter MFP subunit